MRIEVPCPCKITANGVIGLLAEVPLVTTTEEARDEGKWDSMITFLLLLLSIRDLSGFGETLDNFRNRLRLEERNL